MHLARSSRSLLAGAAVAALLAAASCTMISDHTTGVSLKANASACIANCAHSSADQVHAEADRHQAAIQGCQGLSGTERSACVHAEAARHSAAMSQISSGRQECMNNCHRQGSGSAG